MKNLNFDKKWLLSNFYCNKYTFYFWSLILFIFILNNLTYLNLFNFINIIYFFVGIYLADLVSGIIHAFYVDNVLNLFKPRVIIKKDICELYAVSCYASFHHLFPENWSYVPDLHIFTTTCYLLSIPIFLGCFLKFGIGFYFTLFAVFSVFFTSMHIKEIIINMCQILLKQVRIGIYS